MASSADGSAPGFHQLVTVLAAWARISGCPKPKAIRYTRLRYDEVALAPRVGWQDIGTTTRASDRRQLARPGAHFWMALDSERGSARLTHDWQSCRSSAAG
jgi:hypothetical protein